MKACAAATLLFAFAAMGAWAQSGGTINAGFLAQDTEVYTPVGVVDESHFATLQPAFNIQPAEGPAPTQDAAMPRLLPAQPSATAPAN